MVKLIAISEQQLTALCSVQWAWHSDPHHSNGTKGSYIYKNGTYFHAFW